MLGLHRHRANQRVFYHDTGGMSEGHREILPRKAICEELSYKRDHHTAEKSEAEQ